MKSITYIFLSLSIGFILTNCNNDQNQKAESEEILTNSGITLSEQQMKESGIAIGRLPEVSISREIECTGTIDVPPNNRSIIHSLIAASVVSINVFPGDEVEKGEIIAVMEHPNIIDMQLDFINAKAEKLRFDQELKRKEDLFESKVTSERELVEVRTNHSKTTATYQSLLMKLNLIGISENQIEEKGIVPRIYIRSSLNGKIGEIMVNSGEFVEMNVPMFTVINESHIHLELDVFASDATQVRKGQSILFRSPGLEDWYMGAVELINPQVSESNTVRIHGHIEDEGTFKIGSFVEARILITENQVPGISNTELIRLGEEYYLFRLTNNGFEKTRIMSGLSNNEFTEVLTDQQDSLWVVAGNYYLNGM